MSWTTLPLPKEALDTLVQAAYADAQVGFFCRSAYDALLDTALKDLDREASNYALTAYSLAVYFIDRADFPEGSPFHPINQRGIVNRVQRALRD